MAAVSIPSPKELEQVIVGDNADAIDKITTEVLAGLRSKYDGSDATIRFPAADLNHILVASVCRRFRDAGWDLAYHRDFDRNEACFAWTINHLPEPLAE